MLFDPGKDTLAGLLGERCDDHQETRGYLHILDLSRINRMLRPIKAKIAAIQLDIRTHPSLGFALESSKTTIEETTQQQQQQQQQGTDIRLRSQRAIKGNNSSTPNTSTTNSSTGQSCALATVSAISATAATDVLLKRFQTSLTDQFQDVVNKVWWHPFCDDYDLPLNGSVSSINQTGLKPKSDTLGIKSAFSVGRLVARLPEEDADIAEKYYHIMPAHMRRFAVLEQLVELCLTQIRVGQLIVPLVIICARRRADTQTMRLLQHLLTCQSHTFRLDHIWAYDMAVTVESGDLWMANLVYDSPRQFFTASLSKKFLELIEPRHRATFIRHSFEAQLEDNVSISERSKQARLYSWSLLLIKDSLHCHGSLAVNNGRGTRASPCDDTLEFIARRLLEMANNQAEDSRFFDSEMEGQALGPALHSLYLAATRPSRPDKDPIVEDWIRLLDTRTMSSVRLSDFEVIIRAYGTLPNLNALAILLDSLGLYALSMKLLNRMMNNFAYLERNTGSQVGAPCQVTEASIETYLREVEDRRMNHTSNDGWQYDMLLGDWVQRTPDVKRTVYLRMDNSDDETPKQQKDQKIFNLSDNPFDDSPILPPPKIGRKGLVSSVPSSIIRRLPPREVSPAVSGRHLRFSLIPMERPAVSSPDEDHLNYLNSESDTDPNEDPAAVFNPMGLPADFLLEASQFVAPLSPVVAPPSPQDEDYYTASSVSENGEESTTEEEEEEVSEPEVELQKSRRLRDRRPKITIMRRQASHDSDDEYNDTVEMQQISSESDDTSVSDQHDEQNDRDNQADSWIASDSGDEDEDEQAYDEQHQSSHIGVRSDSDVEYIPLMTDRRSNLWRQPTTVFVSPSPPPPPTLPKREIVVSVELPRLSHWRKDASSHSSVRPPRFADALSSGDEYVFSSRSSSTIGDNRQLDNKFSSIRLESHSSDQVSQTLPTQTSSSTKVASTRRKKKFGIRRLSLISSPESSSDELSDEYTPYSKKKLISSRMSQRQNKDKATLVSRSTHSSSGEDSTYEPSSSFKTNLRKPRLLRRDRAAAVATKRTQDARNSNTTPTIPRLRTASRSIEVKNDRQIREVSNEHISSEDEDETGLHLPKRTLASKRRQLRVSDDEASSISDHLVGIESAPLSSTNARRSPPLSFTSTIAVNFDNKDKSSQTTVDSDAIEDSDDDERSSLPIRAPSRAYIPDSDESYSPGRAVKSARAVRQQQHRASPASRRRPSSSAPPLQNFKRTFGQNKRASPNSASNSSPIDDDEPGPPRPSKRARMPSGRQLRVYGSEDSCIEISDDDTQDRDGVCHTDQSEDEIEGSNLDDSSMRKPTTNRNQKWFAL
ncbi:hypothetical protein BGZ83_002316 [Gryganskiella cystojenkinii]|nr:hypothetical protein BGZ83_002316 [Gryganskiella cystojenkinii]